MVVIHFGKWTVNLPASAGDFALPQTESLLEIFCSRKFFP